MRGNGQDVTRLFAAVGKRERERGNNLTDTDTNWLSCGFMDFSDYRLFFIAFALVKEIFWDV